MSNFQTAASQQMDAMADMFPISDEERQALEKLHFESGDSADGSAINDCSTGARGVAFQDEMLYVKNESKTGKTVSELRNHKSLGGLSFVIQAQLMCYDAFLNENYEAGLNDPRAIELKRRFVSLITSLPDDACPAEVCKQQISELKEAFARGLHDAYRTGDTERLRRKAERRAATKAIEEASKPETTKHAESDSGPTYEELGFAENGWKKQSREKLAEFERNSRREVVEIVRTMPKKADKPVVREVKNPKWPEYYEITFYDGFQEISLYSKRPTGKKGFLEDSYEREHKPRRGEKLAEFHQRVCGLFATKLEMLISSEKQRELSHG